jgi:putative redox protein
VADRRPDVVVRWTSELAFACTAPGREPIPTDGNSRAGPSPVELLLMAAASCSAADVVSILQKQRVRLRGLEVEVRGSRRDAPPRRLTAVRLRFTIGGEGVDEPKARRAIDLSLEKYCSVVASLAPDTAISYDVVLA